MSPWKAFGPVPDKQETINKASVLLLSFLLLLLLLFIFLFPFQNGTHSSTLAWKIPWTEEPGGLQSMGSLRVGHD